MLNSKLNTIVWDGNPMNWIEDWNCKNLNPHTMAFSNEKRFWEYVKSKLDMNCPRNIESFKTSDRRCGEWTGCTDDHEAKGNVTRKMTMCSEKNGVHCES